VLEVVGGKRQASAALPPEIYEGHVGETIKQRAENLCWMF